MEISAGMVKELREKTGAGILECKKALAENNGDMEKAAEALMKAGLAKASKKAARIAAEGVVHAYIHSNQKVGVLVEVNCETDFVARNDDFVQFSRDVAMQIAAMSPQYVKIEDVPEEVVAKQRAFYADSEDVKKAAQNKPQNVVDKIIDGKIKKWLQEICLFEQPFVKDDKITIKDLQSQLTAKIGEKISVRRFVRYEVGEGMEKRVDDFAQEVAAQAAGKK